MNYSGTRIDKEFWFHNQTDNGKEILKLKSHETLLSSVSRRNQSGGAPKPASGDGTP